MVSDSDRMPEELLQLLRACEAELDRHASGQASLAEVYAEVRLALDEIDQLRLDGVHVPSSMPLFGRDDPYECGVWLAYALGHVDDAFDLAERGRARGLLDRMLNKRPQRAPRLSDPALQASETELRRRVRELSRRVQAAAGADASAGFAFETAEAGTGAAEDLRRSRDELQALQHAIRKQDPAHAAMRGVAPASLEDLRQLLDAKTALLAYFACADRLVIFVVAREGLASQHVDIARTALAGLVGRYRDGLARSAHRFRGLAMPTEQAHETSGSTHHGAGDAGDDADSRALYELLVRPVEVHLCGKSRLGFIPHAELQRVPFQALRSESGYLIERYAIWYAPSASLLDLCHQRQRKATGRVLALGDPELASGAPRLAFAAEEVGAIAALFGSRALTGKEATLRALRQGWHGADIVHLACHAEWDEHQPDLSALVLAADGEDAGRLEARELFALDVDLPLSHVTLSACQTSLTSGSDLTGLATGFLYAGSPSVVASLWPVNDLSTSELMCEFYRRLSDLDRAGALQAAQRRLLRSVHHAHPYFWAAFNVIGSPAAITAGRTLDVSAFNLQHRWTCRVDSGVLCGPASRDDLLFVTWYAPSRDRAIQPHRESAVGAISLHTRQMVWKHPLTGWARTHACVAGLVHVSCASRVIALRAGDGTVAWQHPTGTSSPLRLACDGQHLYAAGEGRAVMAWDAVRGDAVWRHLLDRPASGGMVMSAGRLFVGCNDHRVYAFDAVDGRLCWSTDVGWTPWVDGPAWVAAGRLHTGVGAYDIDTGQRLEAPPAWPIVAPGEALEPARLQGWPQEVEIQEDDVCMLATAEVVLVSRKQDLASRLDLYDRSSGALLRSCLLGPGRITGLCTNADWVFVGDGAGAIQAYTAARMAVPGH